MNFYLSYMLGTLSYTNLFLHLRVELRKIKYIPVLVRSDLFILTIVLSFILYF
jgi:hypothetical protein